ncbi:uncharacterized protein B0H18DRAFT_991073 [Fomitopsis serialis]|uniref:uncharacterized protein n=1 Tax=Fomitopsis serialis TaxID=139415 RepID=UPI0020077163|nr:uncharacterized protein B0H18DRAFT_991073 [Neoantrodia serialis]KAH9931306.1 hypothetical protein B0H18DRAFT_991073 [Neoantrodia serialis]
MRTRLPIACRPADHQVSDASHEAHRRPDESTCPCRPDRQAVRREIKGLAWCARLHPRPAEGYL